MPSFRETLRCPRKGDHVTGTPCFPSGQEELHSGGLGLERPLLILLCDNNKPLPSLIVWISNLKVIELSNWKGMAHKTSSTSRAQHSPAVAVPIFEHLAISKEKGAFLWFWHPFALLTRRCVGKSKLCLCPLSPRRGRASREASGGNCWCTTPHQNVLFSFIF